MKSSLCFVLALLAVAAGALAFRLPGLDRRPMHVDEAVQAVKFGALLETGVYRYDPDEYHGPTLNYATLVTAWLGAAPGKTLAQINEFTCRIVPALFGVGTVLLLILLVDGLGWPATILAAIFTAISPAMVFYNRYYIHESLLVFFTLGFIGSAWRYVQGRKTGWALLAGAFLGLMHATKETFVLSCAAMLAACVGVIVLNRRGMRNEDRGVRSEQCSLLVPLSSILVVAVIVSVVLFSSFFTDWQGVVDSVRTYFAWSKRAGGATLHNHPWYFYLRLLLFYKEEGGPAWTEGLIVLLALVGFVTAMWGHGIAPLATAEFPSLGGEGRVRGLTLARFLALYTLVLTAIYSFISYKTPWCLLTFLHGMILLAALGAVAIIRSLPHAALKGLACVLLVAGLSHLGWEAYRASFNSRHYADWRNPYVYAHTTNDIRNFAARMDELAQIHARGYDMLVKVIARDYWPVPWYMRRFRQVGYWHEPPDDADAPVIISSMTIPDEESAGAEAKQAEPDMEALLKPVLHARYHKEYFGSRPGVFLLLFVEQGLWDEFVKHRTAGAKN